MVDTFFRLFTLLTKKQKREFLLLQVAMLVSSVLELVGTVSIMPFIALAADPDADGEDVKRETDSVEGERQHRRRPYEIRPPERPGQARWFA